MPESHSMTAASITGLREKHLTCNRQFQGIPGIAVAGDGTLWVTGYSGGTGENRDNFVLLYRSTDRGETWGEAVAAVESPHDDVRCFDAAPFVAPDGRLFLFWAQSLCTGERKSFDGLGGVWFSVLEDDSAMRWSAPRRIADGVMMNKPVVLSNGDWALPVSLTRYAEQPEYHDRAGAMLYRSRDRGESFEFVGKTQVPEGDIYNEHHIVELRDGRLQFLMRTVYGNAESFSGDGGRTWSEPFPSRIGGQNVRLHLSRLKSGRLLLLNNEVNHPSGAYGFTWPRNKIIGWISDDDGRSFYGGLVIDERNDTTYPDAQEGPDGYIYCVYDHRRMELGLISLARFREAEVAAGVRFAKDSRFELTVNRTPGCRSIIRKESAKS